MNQYWRKYPPIHVMIKAYLGYKEPAMPIEASSSDSAISDQEHSMEQFFAAVPQRVFQPPVVKNGN